MPKPLVIVESPAKARTLSRFLGSDYRVEASYGHIRDLPESASEVPAGIKGKSWGRLGVDTDGDFTPYYVVPADKRKHVQALKDAMKDASEVILATDPDREGESISWHLKQLLKPKVAVRRIVFHEITEEAIRSALGDAHEDVDENLVPSPAPGLNNSARFTRLGLLRSALQNRRPKCGTGWRGDCTLSSRANPRHQ